jgi:hypothetical protein
MTYSVAFKLCLLSVLLLDLLSVGFHYKKWGGINWLAWSILTSVSVYLLLIVTGLFFSYNEVIVIFPLSDFSLVKKEYFNDALYAYSIVFGIYAIEDFILRYVFLRKKVSLKKILFLSALNSTFRYLLLLTLAYRIFRN